MDPDTLDEHQPEEVKRCLNCGEVLWDKIDILSPASPEPKSRVGQDKEPFVPQDKPDYKAMWGELLDREDTSLALRDVMKEIKTRHTPQPGADSSRKNVREKPEGKDEE